MNGQTIWEAHRDLVCLWYGAVYSTSLDSLKLVFCTDVKLWLDDDGSVKITFLVTPAAYAQILLKWIDFEQFYVKTQADYRFGSARSSSIEDDTI